jgi:hypothetical protein
MCYLLLKSKAICWPQNSTVKEVIINKQRDNLAYKKYNMLKAQTIITLEL